MEELTDDRGRGHTPIELEEICDVAFACANHETENIQGASTHQIAHLRLHLYKQNKFNHTMASQVIEYVSNLRHRLRLIPKKHRSRPITRPLIELGYIYQAQKSSNNVMNLFEDIGNYAYNGRYLLHHHVIWLCSFPDQASTAKVFSTRVSQGYVGNGEGFSSYAARRSIYSYFSCDGLDWSEFADYAMEMSPWMSNMSDQERELEKRMVEVKAKIVQYKRELAARSSPISYPHVNNEGEYSQFQVAWELEAPQHSPQTERTSRTTNSFNDESRNNHNLPIAIDISDCAYRDGNIRSLSNCFLARPCPSRSRTSEVAITSMHRVTEEGITTTEPTYNRPMLSAPRQP